MGMENIAAAIERVKSILRRKPELALHDDAPATARWEGGLRVVSSHENGTRMLTDMPGELGGSGEHVTPGWVFRASLASCAVTRIAMTAAEEGIELTALEVKANTRTDTRGFLGMADATGTTVVAGPSEVGLHVRISASGVSPERLRSLVEASHRCAPITKTVEKPLPVALHIEVEAA